MNKKSLSIKDNAEIDLKSKLLFFCLLFFSGFCALTYEIIWLRKLRLILGSDSIAIALILSAFMSGMGIGNIFFGHLADKKSPLKIYRFLELAIGMYGIVSIWIVQILNTFFKMIYYLFENNSFILLTIKFLFAFLFLFVPCFFMGGTFPSAVKFLTRSYLKKETTVSLCYGINTFGACLATFAIPFLLLPLISQNMLILLVAIINIMIFIGTFYIPKFENNLDLDKIILKKDDIKIFSLLPWTLFITGFVSISLETVWNRIFSFYLTNSIYSFSLILFVFLAFMSIGSLLLNYKILKKFSTAKIFLLTQAFISIFIIIQFLYLDKIVYLQLKLLSYFELNFYSYMFVSAIIIFLVIGPIALAFGLSFPSAISFLIKDFKLIAYQTGYLTALNTFGTSLSSIFITFIGYKYLGFKNILFLLALLTLFNFLILSLKIKINIIYSIALFLFILIIFIFSKFDFKNLHLLICQKPEWILTVYKYNKIEDYKATFDILNIKEDYEATSSVAEFKEGYKVLYINGKPDASTYENDMLAQYLCGIIPYLYLDKEIKPKIFTLGLGSGSTSYAASCFEPKELITIEICPSVPLLADKYFFEVNKNIVNESKIRIDDGRNYLQNTNEKFDIIISEPSNPWMSGISNLFTEDFFKIVRNHLSEDGVFCQWFYYYKMKFDYLLGIIKTLNSVFTYVNSYNLGGDVILIASNKPLTIKNDKMLFEKNEKISNLLKQIKLDTPEMIFNYFMWNSNQINQLNSQLQPNKDEKNWLEFIAQKYIFKNSTEENLEKIHNTFDSSLVPLNLKFIEEENFYLLKEINLKIINNKNIKIKNYFIEKKFFKAKNFLEIAFHKVKIEDHLGNDLLIYSPLTNKALNKDLAEFILLEDMINIKEKEIGQITSPDHTYTCFIKNNLPFQFSAFWNCEKSNKSFFITIKNPNKILKTEDIISILKIIKCH